MLDLLQRKVLEMEDRLARASSEQPERVAVFDLDGTLLEGDIGEAVFAHLITSGHPLRLSWQEYQRQLHTHRSKAYRSIVQAMAGLNVETILQATRAVMEGGKDYLTMQSDSVRKPTPRPPLARLVSFLQDRQYVVYVLSASNNISVQYVSAHWFNIPCSHSFGIQSHIRNERLTSELVDPVTIGSGKAQLLQSISPSLLPLITATDSRIDIPLLRLTHPLGLSFWIGDDSIDFGVLLEALKPSQEFCFVETTQRFPSNDF